MKSTLQKLLNIRSIIFFVCGLLMSGVAISQSPTATQVAADMGVAWNLGNTLEPACGEGCWAPAATPELINAVAAAGFKTIRIPVAWDSHADNSYQIDPAWLARVKEVVDYCYANNLYVLINNHYDNGWFASNGFRNFDSNLNDKFQAYWTQIANTFVDYDSHLLFCAANEPHVESASQTDVLLQYYQTFVDAVRATGGQNTTRCLVLSGPRTNIQDTYDWMNSLPTDPTPDRLMAEVHYYDPYQFALMEEDATWGNTFYYWGQGYHSTVNTDRNANWGEEDWVEGQFDLMQTKFVNNGIPVILGEFGAIKRSGIPEESLHIASREYFHNYVKTSAQNHGLVPVYWDNGWGGQNGFALFDRNTAAVVDQGTIDALTGGGSPGNVAPVASFTWSSTDLTVDFDGSGSSDSDGTIVSYDWDFGDGNTGTGQTINYAYAGSGNYTVTLTVTDDGGASNTDSQVVSVSDGSNGGGTGTILREYWTNIGGSAVSDLTSDANYPNNPSGNEQLTSLEGPINWADNYGTRIRGYIHPTTSGSYTFWVAGDDNTELYLSTDDNPANSTLIGSVTGWTNSREWTKYSTQQSSAVNLVAGQKYYIEVLHKESGGGDNVAVAWQGPGISQQVINGVFLSPYVPVGGGGPTSVHVQSISTDTQNAGKGNKYGTATITILDNFGNGVSSATVTGTFSGSFSETVTGTTDLNGNVTLVTTATAKGGVTVDICVDNVTHSSLTYDQAQNAITCTGSGARFSASQSDELVDPGNFKLYPNPSNGGHFYIDVPNDGEKRIQIFNMQGKLVHSQVSKGENKLEVNSVLDPGIYMIRIYSESDDVSRKLVIR